MDRVAFVLQSRGALIASGHKHGIEENGRRGQQAEFGFYLFAAGRLEHAEPGSDDSSLGASGF